MHAHLQANGPPTILNASEDSVKHASALALAALGWILADGPRAHRFLDLTGLTPDRLRGAIEDTAVHRAVFEFLAAHEPDLVAAADSLGIAPETLARAGQELGA